MRGGRSGRGRGDRGRRDARCTPTRPSTRRVDYEQIAARSWPRPTPSTEPRTSATASGAAMSCHRSSRPPKVGAAGCARPSTTRRATRRGAAPDPRATPQRLQDAKRRLEEEHRVECQANADYEAYRARGRMKDGRRFGRPPDPHEPPADTGGQGQSHRPGLPNVKTPRGWVQGYNAQAVCTRTRS